MIRVGIVNCQSFVEIGRLDKYINIDDSDNDDLINNSIHFHNIRYRMRLHSIQRSIQPLRRSYKTWITNKSLPNTKSLNIKRIQQSTRHVVKHTIKCGSVFIRGNSQESGIAGFTCRLDDSEDGG